MSWWGLSQTGTGAQPSPVSPGVCACARPQIRGKLRGGSSTYATTDTVMTYSFIWKKAIGTTLKNVDGVFFLTQGEKDNFASRVLFANHLFELPNIGRLTHLGSYWQIVVRASQPSPILTRPPKPNPKPTLQNQNELTSRQGVYLLFLSLEKFVVPQQSRDPAVGATAAALGPVIGDWLGIGGGAYWTWSGCLLDETWTSDRESELEILWVGLADGSCLHGWVNEFVSGLGFEIAREEQMGRNLKFD